MAHPELSPESGSSSGIFAARGEMSELMRSLDWSGTPLGPVDAWPQSLKTVVRILLTSRYAMWTGWGPDLTFFYNDAYQPTLGVKHPWALGKPAREVWAEIWPDIGPRIETVLREGEATWDEALLLFLKRRGYPEETYHTFSYSPLSDDAGRVGGMLCVVTEETERIIGERRLALLRALASETSPARSVGDACERAARTLEAAQRDLPFALGYLADAGGDLQRVMTSGIDPAHPLAPPVIASCGAETPWSAGEVASGEAPAKIVDVPVSAGSVPCGGWDRPPTSAIILPIAQQGQTRPAGVFIFGLNPYRPFDAAFRGFVDLVAGQIATALANVQALEAERKRAEALAELDRAKTAFFSNVSHEFRTPLTLMLGPVEDSLGSPSRALVGESLETVHRNSLRLLKLVNNLLDFSRIEAGRVDAAYVPTNIAGYTAELASVFRSAMERAGLKLIVDCEPGREPVYLDLEMWEKVVLNLLSNAFKFTLEGEVEVRTLPVEGGVVVSVRDTGCGIPAEELPHLFERFHRVPGAQGRTSEGTGIGLALVQELVRLHGGAITAASQPGRGSTFTISVPYGTAHLPPDRVNASRQLASTALGAGAFLEEALRWLPDDTGGAGTAVAEAVPAAAAAVGVAPPPGGARARVVLADDNADMRRYVERLMAGQYEVEAVADGAAALAAVRRERPDLVLTDVMMPRLDGFGLLREIRGDPQTQDLPVVLLSARAGEEARVEGLQAGADDYLVKPFSARELLARIDAHLQMARIRREAAERERELQHSLEVERLRLLEIFQEAPAIMATLRGPEHVFEFANPGYVQLVGRGEIVGKRLSDALPEIREQGFIDLLDRVYATGEPYVGRETRVLVQRDRSVEMEEVFLDFVYLPLRDASGETSGIFVHAVDITEQVRARRSVEALAEQNRRLYGDAQQSEAAARARAEELAVADRQKDEFLAMLAHELRNPLAPVLNAVQVLRARGGDDPVVKRQEAVIDRQARHMAHLLDDLLDVSRITRGKIALQKQLLEFGSVVDQVVDASWPLIDQRHQELSVSIPREPLYVEGDPTRLHQIVGNLLSNAAKYTDSGGRISLAVQPQGGDVVLRVADSGVGIAPEFLPRVFDLFAQADRSLARLEGGLGIGLTMVQRLVQLHGGSVEAHSEGLGKGSEFVVRLPLARLVTPEVPASGGGNQRRAEAALRVLIVDDNEDAANTLGDLIGLWGSEVRVVHDGHAALAAAAEFRPDAVLLDISMPDMDGYEVARRLRRQAEHRDTLIVAITGYGQEEDRRRSLEAGFDRHLTKPVDPDALEAILRARAEAPTAIT